VLKAPRKLVNMSKKKDVGVKQVGSDGDVVAEVNPVSDAASAQATDATENEATVQNDEGKENKVVNGNTNDAPVETVETGPEPVTDDLNVLCGESADASTEQTGEVVESVPEEVPAVETVPEPERPMTGEEIQEAREATEEDTWDAEAQGVMQNPTLRQLTPYIKGALVKDSENRIQIGIHLAQGHTAVNEKSFRIWVKKVLKMEEKQAYELRSIGAFFGPLLKARKVTLSYLCSLGTSRLVTLTRFPETYRRIDATGHIFISDGAVEKPAEKMPNDELRTVLQTVKNTGNSKHDGLLLYLDDVFRRFNWRHELRAEVEPKKDTILPKVMAWDADLEATLKEKDKKIENLQKSIKDANTDKERVVENRGRAKWWLDLLNGKDGEMPEWEENAAKAREQEAATERSLNAQARTEKTRNRR